MLLVLLCLSCFVGLSLFHPNTNKGLEPTDKKQTNIIKNRPNQYVDCTNKKLNHLEFS